MRHTLPIVVLLSAGISLAGCTGPVAKQTAPAATTIHSDAKGYLAREAIPDSKALSPPPPAAGSAAQALDDDISRRFLVLEGSPRWQLAARDAMLDFPAAAGTFSCALNAPITQETTPMVYTLLRRTLIDAARVTGAAKDFYKRPRPFMVNGHATCTPASEDILRRNGSYPSGHSAAGWVWALVLAEVSPEQSTAILARGRAFAESRLACNVHWYSDTLEGITLGSAVVAREHAEPTFVADVAAARKELAAVRAKGVLPTGDCAAEAAALKSN
jgi:acid phosphatase (class A)